MTLESKIEDFAVNTSMHGINHIYTSKRSLLKIFWSVIVLAGIAVCIWYIYLSILNFLSYPVLVQTEMTFKPLPFPAVTICNLNPVRKSKLSLVPQLQQLLSVCDLKTDLNATTTPTDFCASYRASKIG